MQGLVETYLYANPSSQKFSTLQEEIDGTGEKENKQLRAVSILNVGCMSVLSAVTGFFAYDGISSGINAFSNIHEEGLSISNDVVDFFTKAPYIGSFLLTSALAIEFVSIWRKASVRLSEIKSPGEIN